MGYEITKQEPPQSAHPSELLIFGIKWGATDASNKIEVVLHKDMTITIRQYPRSVQGAPKEIWLYADEAKSLLRGLEKCFREREDIYEKNRIDWFRNSGWSKTTKSAVQDEYQVILKKVPGKKPMINQYWAIQVKIGSKWKDLTWETQSDKIRTSRCFFTKEEALSYIQNKIKTGDVVFMRRGVIYNGYSDG